LAFGSHIAGGASYVAGIAATIAAIAAAKRSTSSFISKRDERCRVKNIRASQSSFV